MYKRFENIFLIGFAILAIGLGWWGYARAGSDFMAGSAWHPIRPFWGHEAVRCLICSVGLLRLWDLFQPWRDPWQLVVAQIAVPGVALLSAAQLFLSGVRKNIRTALARHKTSHTIVCGIGDVGMQVVQNLRSEGHHLVAVDLVDDSANSATCEKSGVPVLQGDAKNPEVLLAAGIRHAQRVILSTGSDSENMDIALQISAIKSKPTRLKAGKIQILAEMRNEWLHGRLTGSDKSSLGSADVDVRLFNPYTDAARMLIKRLHLPPAPEFEARTFVLAGFGAYGREIATHLIRSWPVALGQTLRIIVFDEKAVEAKERFSITNPAASEMATLEFVNASVTPGSSDLARDVSVALEAAGPLLGVAVALGDDQTSLCAALEMRSLLDRKGDLAVPIYVRLEHYRRLGELIRNLEGVSRFGDRLQIFGTLEETLSSDVLFGSQLDSFAKALHDDYRHRARGQINPQADVAWHALPEFMKMSNRWRADHTPLLMELAGLHVAGHVASPTITALNEEQIETMAELEHRRYTIERRLLENRSGSAQRSLPSQDWNQLPDEQKNWNRKEVARLPELMAGLGLEVRPVQTVRLYGKRLADGARELEANRAKLAHVHMIADLDDAGAVRLAAGALDLTSLSLWLLSHEIPREFSHRKPQDQSAERAAVIQRANGWLLRERTTLQE